ncbi:hypothetical protein GCM10007424_26430 [Flavobacterium suaedae]|uniref:DUF2007 domain-containing protein n=1 Tax=Flavobacterium suaedae TaxID=1767027 RepID=A0ABQ1K5F9_9FLAO|nr:hypothetical protein [Flavobacterium suaedae]GGB85096.1 hypothetical protein GCM10007424_26430 [Flavobacterium suaedae]
MNRKIVKEKLSNIGYQVFDKDSHIWGGVKGETGPLPDTFVINKGFEIFFNDDKATVVLINSIVNESKDFNTENELIDFIKDYAPLKT